jgi:hypothetical protein
MSNPHWELKDGKMQRKEKSLRVPKGVHTEAVTCNGMTLSHTKTREFTFTIAQLKYATTADKPYGLPVERKQVLALLASTIRANRWELFGTYEGYNIITNGYGQFKEIAFSHGNPVKASTIFNKLETL